MRVWFSFKQGHIADGLLGHEGGEDHERVLMCLLDKSWMQSIRPMTLSWSCRQLILSWRL